MPPKIIFTQEMIDDLYKMGDRDFEKKWDITHPPIHNFRIAHNIPSFTIPCGTIPHKFENGIEYKWCGYNSGHWELLENFYKSKRNYDGLGRTCKVHLFKSHRKSLKKRRGVDWKPKFRGIAHNFIDGVEHKWCPVGKHWVLLDGFYKCSTRYDGVAGVCIQHSKEYTKIYAKTEKSIQRTRAWKQSPNGKECARRTWRRKKAEKERVYISWLKSDEHFAYDLFDHKCAYCGTEIEFLTLEFDHFVPIKLGGLTEPKNMVPCCYVCNHGDGGKFAKDALEWLTEKFGERIALLIYLDVKKKLKQVRKIEYIPQELL
jgi:5-methylcytosine-specific restriction endonuclease McrA